MIRTVILDDEPMALKILEKTLSSFEDIEIIQSFTSSKNLLKNIHHLNCQVAFLDIEMPEINGIELAKILHAQEETIHVVFITAHRDYAIDAFEVNSMDYLLKPISKTRLKMSIQRIRERLKHGNIPTTNELDNTFPLKIQCFGNFNIFFNNEVFRWRTSKMRELFAYLLQHQPTPIHKDNIIETLWREDDYQKARIKLYTTISYLRKSFATIGYHDIIGSANESYFLNLVEFHCDAKELHLFTKNNTMINEETIAKAEEIFESYKGDYLQNNDYHWSTTKANYLHDQLLLLGNQLTEYYTMTRQLVKREHILLTLLKLEPYEETYIQQLLHHFIETGNHSSAIDIYTQYKNRLLNELKLSPSKDTIKIYDEIIQHISSYI